MNIIVSVQTFWCHFNTWLIRITKTNSLSPHNLHLWAIGWSDHNSPAHKCIWGGDLYRRRGRRWSAGTGFFSSSRCRRRSWRGPEWRVFGSGREGSRRGGSSVRKRSHAFIQIYTQRDHDQVWVFYCIKFSFLFCCFFSLST